MFASHFEWTNSDFDWKCRTIFSAMVCVETHQLTMK